MAKKRKKTRAAQRGRADRSGKKASIIVLVMDKLEFTRLCVGAIFANTSAFELVIVDNGSGRATQDYLAELARAHDNVTIVRSETNLGFAGGCNAGVRASRHGLICLLNNDTIPQPGWLDRMREVFTPGVGIVGAKLLFPVDTIQHCGIVFLEDMRPYHRYHDHPMTLAECNRLEKMPAVTAACMLTSRKIYDEVDGLDEGFVRGNYEDVDFNLKVRDRGYAVLYEPEAVVYHFCNMTNSEDVESGRAATDQNWRLYSARWGTRHDLAEV